MKSVPFEKIKDRKKIKKMGANNQLKYLIPKVVKVFSFDASPIFKSKEWPHL